MGTLALGYGLGLLVAAQLGPMSLFLVRYAAAGATGVGLIGFGALLGWRGAAD